ncbi:hypothetical protein M8J77_000641 [Diaphorina citri]|nr:hypothetical protein M8J77_000641 [Diaphorina citri]
MLVEFMEEHGLIALNGRTPGDIPGQFTFISKVGNSVVDLVWTNMELCSDVVDLTVSADFLTSDHLPVVLNLDFKWGTENITALDMYDTNEEITRFIWCEEKSQDFARLMNENVNLPEEISESYIYLKNKIQETVSNLGMTYQSKPNKKFIYNRNPWFNHECRNLKKEMRKQYKKWLKTRDNEIITKYLQLKKAYFSLCKEKKKTYEENFKSKLRNVKNASDFWKTVTKFKPRKENKCQQISISTWDEHLRELFPPLDPVPPLMLSDVTRDKMDCDFNMIELNKCISKLKNGKSPGPDNLLNEYLKTLDGNCRNELLNFLNFLFDGGDPPTELTKSYMFMLHKKGDLKNPNNYRSIALLNNILKLGTQLLAQRVLHWCETNGLFIEAQAGFRPGRGCMDNVFTLASIISLSLIRHRKLYAAFVDFRSAFSEINHELLWLKMFNFGISRKVIAMFQKLYGNAETQIRVGNKFSSPQNITKGVLQGDSASPLVFLIFVNDLEEHMRSKGMHGVSITESTDILLLLYADDLILFASDKIDL